MFILPHHPGGDEEGEDHVPYSPMSQEAAQEVVQLTCVLYDQRDYNRARRWRLPRLTLSPGEYQARPQFVVSTGLGFSLNVSMWLRS